MKNKNEMQIIISRRSISNSDHEFKKEQKYGATDSCIPCAERKINAKVYCQQRHTKCLSVLEWGALKPWSFISLLGISMIDKL